MRIRLHDTIEFFVLLATFFLIPWSVSNGIIGYVLAFLVFMMLVFFNLFRIVNASEISISLCIPVMLSAFQNVGLGIFSPALSKTEVQFLTVLNFIYAVFVFICLVLGRYKRIKSTQINYKIWALFWALILYSVFSLMFLSNRNILSILSSARNIFSLYLFLFIGILASDKIKLKRFEQILFVVGLIVVFIGLYEVFINPSMWRSLHITGLWNKKGIRVQTSGLPTNFYSSETINGHRIRRMTSSFADPVNLGAFLFVFFTLAWYSKKKNLIWISLLAIVLTVSKGALLGLLIFFTVYAYSKYSKPGFYFVLFLSVVAGIGFLFYASSSSANSVFFHISGLRAAIRGIISEPLGSGLGSNGVLARQFSAYSSNAGITETGLGMIIGQLGIVGLVIYVFTYIYLMRGSLLVEGQRERILCLTLLISIMTNMFFNEVALSPNSCAAYYMIIGAIVGSTKAGGWQAVNTVRTKGSWYARSN